MRQVRVTRRNDARIALDLTRSDRQRLIRDELNRLMIFELAGANFWPAQIEQYSDGMIEFGGDGANRLNVGGVRFVRC